ncbi:hypothetical protein GJ496_011632 [Pomphorhynchus laevis]|nr:hypothetical protein GJ496_011632 [Pomphorhynchus laevis]
MSTSKGMLFVRNNSFRISARKIGTKEIETIRTWTRGQRHSRSLSIPNSLFNVVNFVTNENDISQESITLVNDTNCTGYLIE